MNQKVRSFSHFFLSSHFYESIKVTIGVLTPSLVLAQFGQLSIGISLSLGAMCANIVDAPGPMRHRRNAMILTTPLLFIFTFLACATNFNAIASGVFLVISSFIFTMLYVYGNRAASIGIAVLLMVVISLDNQNDWEKTLIYCSAVFMGSLWYTMLSYIFHRIRPYRFAQQSISEYILEVAEFVRIKSYFYQYEVDDTENYSKLLSQQVIINDKQDAIREILFTTRNIVKDGTPEGRFLTQVFIDSVDLFEQLMSTQYNYRQLREELQKSTVLFQYYQLLTLLASDLDNIAYSFNIGEIPKYNEHISGKIQKIWGNIQALEEEQEEHGITENATFALKNILVNVKAIYQKIKIIHGYFSQNKDSKYKFSESSNLEKFVTQNTKIDFAIFRENLTFKSNTFRFALRFSIIMGVGFIISKMLNSSHSYWVLLSILVILKPAFSQTKQRNIQRIIGTVIGGIMGFLIIYYIHNHHFLFFILLFCMVIAFSFMRTHYIIYVLFMTPYLFVAYSFLGLDNSALVKERILDTFIGAAIAIVGTYILLPTWEYVHSKKYINSCLSAINNYFIAVCNEYLKEYFEEDDFKLARKEVYVSISNMSSMVNKMFEEPKSKQFKIRDIQQINSLMYLFSSYAASLHLFKQEHAINSDKIKDFAPIISQISLNLGAAQHQIENIEKVDFEPLKPISLEDEGHQDGSKAVRDMLLRLQNLSSEIYKLSVKIAV